MVLRPPAPPETFSEDEENELKNLQKNIQRLQKKVERQLKQLLKIREEQRALSEEIPQISEFHIPNDDVLGLQEPPRDKNLPTENLQTLQNVLDPTYDNPADLTDDFE